MERATVEVYDERADEWARRRGPGDLRRPRRFAARLDPGWRADLGCGPGWHSRALGEPVVALDAAPRMVELARRRAPGAHGVVADLEALPLRRGALGGAWASKAYLHVAAERIPLAWADLHRTVRVGGRVALRLLGARPEESGDLDDFPGRYFSRWAPGPLRDVLTGAGFEVGSVAQRGEWIDAVAVRARTLADHVGPGMRLLVCGLNPSEHAADAGVPFARPGNRAWPALLASGLVSRDRDPRHALVHHGVGTTDLVKRATPAAGALGAAEYRTGRDRVARLAAWLRPAAVCVLGVTGWRAAVDPGAGTGWQPTELGGCPVYLAPNPSGRNAHTDVADVAGHLAAAARVS